MRSEHSGFTLLEMIAGMAIITIGLTAAIPPYLRNMRQGEVDRYTQQLEAGLFGLRAKLGQQKTSCTLQFDKSGLTNFVAPTELVEMNQHPERMECCNSDIEAAGQPSGCDYGVKIGKLLAQESSGAEKDKIIRDRTLRLLDQEGTRESKEVEVSVNLGRYELTPPGTSTMSEDLIFLIRSTNTRERLLRTRCILISSTGNIFRASWNHLTSSCEKRKASQ